MSQENHYVEDDEAGTSSMMASPLRRLCDLASGNLPAKDSKRKKPFIHYIITMKDKWTLF